MSKYEHPEWEIENSLTSPSDRDPARTYQPNQGSRALTEEEVKNAMNTLNNKKFENFFLKVERRYADPVESMQRIGLFSFVPAKGATPNEKGVYGFAKLRGNYPTDQEANERAEYLIRNVTLNEYGTDIENYSYTQFDRNTSNITDNSSNIT